MAVMRFDPFRDFDRFTEQFFGGPEACGGFRWRPTGVATTSSSISTCPA
jgi:hypothetical protein